MLTDHGFSYSVRDRDTGLEFEAYSGASGPAYGAAPADVKRLRPVLAAFDTLLDATPLAECRLDIPVGDRKRFVVGVKHGVPFEHLASPPPPTNAEAVATAKRVLATENSDAMFYYVAVLKLHEAAPRQRVLLRKRWRRSLAVALAALDAELVDGDRDRVTTLVSIIDVELGALARTAKLAGVVYGDETRPHRKQLADAKRRIAKRRISLGM
ncbi:MAG: hypothetical protein ABJE66_19550 [Deltaproteobacteria bacterium]